MFLVLLKLAQGMDISAFLLLSLRRIGYPGLRQALYRLPLCAGQCCAASLRIQSAVSILLRRIRPIPLLHLEENCTSYSDCVYQEVNITSALRYTKNPVYTFLSVRKIREHCGVFTFRCVQWS